MKVWEALEILEGLDPNAEVTITIRVPRESKKEPRPYTQPYPYTPQWVPGTTYPYITCKNP